MGPRAEDIFVLIERYNVESDTPLWRRKGDDFLLGILHQALAGPRDRLDTYGKQAAIRVFRKVEDGAARAIQNFVRRCHANAPGAPKSHGSVVVKDVRTPNAHHMCPVSARPDSRACHESLHEFPRPVTLRPAKRQSCHQTDSRAQPRFDGTSESHSAPHKPWYSAYGVQMPTCSELCPNAQHGASRVPPREELTRQTTAPHATPPTYCRAEGNFPPPRQQRNASFSREVNPQEYATPAAARSCTETPTPYNTMRQVQSPNDASIASSHRWSRAKWTHLPTRRTPETSTPVSNPRTSPTGSVDEPVVPSGCIPKYRAVYKPRNSYGCRRAFVLAGTLEATSTCTAEPLLGENSHGTEQHEARNSQRFAYRRNRWNGDTIGLSDQVNAIT
eukprot:GEMP01066271.1.p1 GENE.GEMP01066271.1~~GEMP01066271.1.p1  ORF type:complete len:389 (+),score=74.33 GEMP01066271.1:79-1245(+)